MSDPNSMHFSLKNPAHFIALGFGSGLLRPAPGTWGTLAAVPLYIAFSYWNPYGLDGFLIFICLALGLGIYVCGKTASDAGVHDHSAIVWDEIVGYFITLIALSPTMLNMLLAFILFRFFDIIKPWPIRNLDRSVQSGFGIMIDDVIAGMMACIVLHLLQPLIV